MQRRTLFKGNINLFHIFHRKLHFILKSKKHRWRDVAYYTQKTVVECGKITWHSLSFPLVLSQNWQTILKFPAENLEEYLVGFCQCRTFLQLTKILVTNTTEWGYPSTIPFWYYIGWNNFLEMSWFSETSHTSQRGKEDLAISDTGDYSSALNHQPWLCPF